MEIAPTETVVIPIANADSAVVFRTPKFLHKRTERQLIITPKIRTKHICAEMLEQILNMNTNGSKDAILRVIQICGGGLTATEISKLAKVSLDHTYHKLGELKKSGQITTDRDNYGFLVYNPAV